MSFNRIFTKTNTIIATTIGLTGSIISYYRACQKKIDMDVSKSGIFMCNTKHWSILNGYYTQHHLWVKHPKSEMMFAQTFRFAIYEAQHPYVKHIRRILFYDKYAPRYDTTTSSP